MELRILKDLFALFSITLPIRYTQKQIDMTVSVISNYFSSKKISVEPFKIKQGKRTYTSLFVNSPKNRESIIIAALDTPSFEIFCNKHSYLDIKKNLRRKRNSLIISIFLSIFFITFIIIMTLHSNFNSNFSKGIFVIVIGVIVILTSWISSEHAVRHNDPNNCSLAISMKLLENHPDAGLILVDGFYQNIGLSFLIESHTWLKNKHCLFIGEIDTHTQLSIYHNNSPQLRNNALSQFNNLDYYVMMNYKQHRFGINQNDIDFEVLSNLSTKIEKEL